jgi:hypothetical protein
MMADAMLFFVEITMTPVWWNCHAYYLHNNHAHNSNEQLRRSK